MGKRLRIKSDNDSANRSSSLVIPKVDESVLPIVNLLCMISFFFLFLIYTLKIVSSVSEKQTSFSCTVKKRKRPLCSACCSSLPFAGCMHEGILRLLSLQGTSPNSFSVNFHPLPNSDEPFLPPTPQWRICPRSLCPPLISFFWLLPLCRQHAAYANRSSFIRETPPLNECNLKWGHTCARSQRGHGTCT